MSYPDTQCNVTLFDVTSEKVSCVGATGPPNVSIYKYLLTILGPMEISVKFVIQLKQDSPLYILGVTSCNVRSLAAAIYSSFR